MQYYDNNYETAIVESCRSTAWADEMADYAVYAVMQHSTQ